MIINLYYIISVSILKCFFDCFLTCIAMTIKSFVHFFKSGRGQGDKVPLWDLKGESPLMNKNSKQNLRKQILTITI